MKKIINSLFSISKICSKSANILLDVDDVIDNKVRNIAKRKLKYYLFKKSKNFIKDTIK